ncbi:uncharacterized protein LOC116343419 [Contarinia nasturtii]|uniref:uncharacterized protein LOC116343419 n=1 Tax=Contarinia nasturtii TaxID=265458 RepID=UPI0012D3BB67|nr:uncharacterized protein LOC116343419 [Contarinia nasturtii]XP_031627324.1 uncharacterized protein LOC116343419 [Contarinia nasturtii]XP_031627332.1 uncharacterized protein LOC116343419 [Contarinia nasturtii]
MDSFAQQMLSEIDRRCKAYKFSTTSISLHYECNAIESENEIDHEEGVELDDVVSNSSTEPVSITANLDEDEVEKPINFETIYANSNIIKREPHNICTVKNTAVPVGRKPALPPKPQKNFELNITKSKGFVQNACAAIFDRKSPPNKKDPAEMSLKERLALFEKNKGIVCLPKATPGLSISTKKNGTRNKSDQTIVTAPLITHTSIDTLNEDNSFVSRKSDYADGINGISSIANGQNNDSDKTERIDAESNLRPKPIPNIVNQVENVKVIIQERRRNSSPKSPPPPPPTKHSKHEHFEACTIEKDEPLPECSLATKRKSVDLMTVNRIQNMSMTASLYGDLTPIVIAPTKMKPDETIGLNELHHHQSEPNEQLLDNFNPYQQKDEDRWEKFIECLLFFCCVG